MRRLLGFIALVAVMLTSFALLMSVSAAEQDYYIYTAEDISTLVDASSDIKYTYETRDGSSFVSFKLKSASSSGTYLRVNFYPSTANESAYVPEFRIKDYPIVVVSAKTNIVNTASTLAANAGMKISTTGKYERCWALNSSTTFVTSQTSDRLTKVVFDVSSFSGYNGGSATWSNVDSNSGLKYFRIPPWNKTASTSNWSNEYFDIEYIGVFKNAADANAFSYTDYRDAQENTVELYDENGALITTHYVSSGDTLRLPELDAKGERIFVGWYNEAIGETVRGRVTVFNNIELTATYAEAKIFTGETISAWASASNFDIKTTVFDKDGNVFVRVSNPEGNKTYGNNDFALFTLGESIKRADYPYVVMGYRSTITDYGNWALSVSLKLTSGSYNRFWGLSYDHVNDGEDHKMIFDTRNISSTGENSISKNDIASDTDIKYLRITPYGSNFGVEKTTGQHFDITYIAFFKDEAAAKAFEYDPEAAVSGDGTHGAFMFRDGEYAFRPTQSLTRAEAASAIARLIEDYGKIEGKYEASFSDVSEADWYYDEVAYLERLGYIGSGSAFDPNSPITKGELASWLKAASDAGEDISEYPGNYTSSSTITRAEAAKVLCQVSGRAPTADGIRYASTAYFSDVDRSTTNYAYIVEATYTHTYELDPSNNEKWLSSDDNDFYMSKASDTLVAELDAEFDRRASEIRASASEYPKTIGNSWWGNRTYYVSSKNGSDSNNGTSSSTPFKTLDKISSLSLKSGDVVLLERGSEFRISSAFSLKSGVTYSAYGTGDKPRVLASVDASSPSQWSAVSGCPGLYVFNQTFNANYQDIGNIVFNDGEMYAQRVIKEFTSDKLFETGRDNIVGNGRDFWELDVDKYEFKDYTDILDIVEDQKAAGKNPDLIYFHYWDEYAGGNDKVYLYSAKGNPGDLFESIDLCKRGNVIWVEYSYSNITLDNWALFYGGSHGVGASSCSNLTVRNCEIGWIGGSIQYITPSNNEVVRFGNGIEIYGEANGFYAYNNYIYQCFDCGPTVQWSGKLGEGDGDAADGIVIQQNVEFYDNVLFDSALEVWLSTTSENTDTQYAKLINCKMYDNLVKGGGYGFAGYNHQKNEPCQFYGGGSTKALYQNCVMENNKFWGSKVNILKANATSTVDGQGFKWINNLIVHPYDGKLGSLATDTKTSTGKTVWYQYNNSVLSQLLATETFGYNEFMYTLSAGQADPIEEHNANLAQKSEYIEIRTVEDLMAMTADGKYKLMADIDLEGIVWTPVGTAEAPFTGEFDGNGHEISNLKAHSNSSVSMFGVCDGAKITNLNITDASVTVNGGDGDVYAALIAHKAIDRTDITDCTVGGSIEVNTNGNAYAAGICAYNAASDIAGCESATEVVVNAGGTGYAAGICAYLYSDAKLSECTNRGTAGGDTEALYNGGVYAYKEADASNSSLAPTVENCRNFAGIIHGDVNGDGSVTPVDTVIFTRYLASWSSVQSIFVDDNADVDDDGQISLNDVVALARHLANWKGYERLPVIMD